MEKENFWEQFASTFEEKNNYVVGEKNIKIFLDYLSKESTIGTALELACGGGTYTQVLVKNASFLHATDISDQMIEVCKKRFKDYNHMEFSTVDCYNLPFKDESFDTVFMANLLHIIPDAYQVVDGCKRVLKKDGKIIILDTTQENMDEKNKEELIERYEKTYGKANKKGNYPFKKEDMENYLLKKEFKIIESCFIGDYVNAIFIKAEKI